MKWLKAQLVLCGFAIASDNLSVKISPGNVDGIFLETKMGMPRDIREVIVNNIKITPENALLLLAGFSFAKYKGVIQATVFEKRRCEIINLFPEIIKHYDFDYRKIAKNSMFAFIRSYLKNYLRLHELTSYSYVLENSTINACLYGDYKHGVSWIIKDSIELQVKDKYGKTYLIERNPGEEIIASFCNPTNRHMVLVRNSANGNYFFEIVNERRSLQIPSPILSTTCTFDGEYWILTCNGPKNYLFNSKTGEMNQLNLLSTVVSVFLKDNKHLLGLDSNKKLTIFDTQTMCIVNSEAIDEEINATELYTLDLSQYNYSYFIMYRKPHSRAIYGRISDQKNIEFLKTHSACCSAHIFLPEKQIALLIHGMISILTMDNGLVVRNIDAGSMLKNVHHTLVYDYSAQEISWINYTNKSRGNLSEVKTIKKDLSEDTAVVLFFAKICSVGQKEAYMPLWALKEQQDAILEYAKKYDVTIKY
jgi:hypothetical protein